MHNKLPGLCVDPLVPICTNQQLLPAAVDFRQPSGTTAQIDKSRAAIDQMMTELGMTLKTRE